MDDTRQALRKVADGFEDSEQAAKGLRQSLEVLKDTQSQLNRESLAQEKFDRTSRKVALAGDVQSNLGAISGIAGAAGAGGLSSGIGLGGEFVALLEEVPRLKESLKGIPDVARAAANSLNTNVLTLGAFGGALAALTIALQIGAQAAEASSKAHQSQLSALHQQIAVSIEARQLTSDEIRTKKENLAIQQEVLKAQHATNQAVLTQLENQNFVIRGIGELSSALGVGDQSYRVARDAIAKTSGELGTLAAQQRGYDTALKSSEVAANDAARAELELSTARSTELSNVTKAIEQANTAERQRATTLRQTARSALGKDSRSIDASVVRAQIAAASRGRSRKPGSSATSTQNEAIQIANDFAENANSLQDRLRDGLRGINQGLMEGIQDLRINQRRDVSEARRTGSILAIRDITRQSRFAAEDLNREANRDRLNAQQDFDREMTALHMNHNQQRIQMAQQAEQAITASLGRIVHGFRGMSFASMPK